jgi:hypothetical protein
MTTTYPRNLLTWALWYAHHGWHVFPLRPGSKRPATPDHRAQDCDHTDPRCRPTHTGWEQRATTDPDRIGRAWTARPWGIGIATGPSGLLVVDTDTPDQPDQPHGETVLADLAAAHGGLPGTFAVNTPSGGRHRYYTQPEGLDLGNTASRLGPHIDTRGVGGYVVAPPTRIHPPTHTHTGAYRVVQGNRPAPLPGWLADLLATPPRPPSTPPPPGGTLTSGYVRAAVEGETTRVRRAAEGTRNHTLFTAAVALGQLVGAGVLHPDNATAHLLRACAQHVADGAFTEPQAHATIASGLRAGRTQPRTLRAA